jgi:integrase/recombinase XerD
MLNENDIDTAYQLLAIRQSKGRKDRIVPISNRALQWIKRYQQEARPQLQRDPSNPALFLSRLGNRLNASTCLNRINAYIRQVLPDQSGGCHLIRHSVATLLLNQGCDIRIIQEFLGHRNLNTTQQYLHVDISRLKQVYQQCHPLAQS